MDKPSTGTNLLQTGTEGNQHHWAKEDVPVISKV